MILLSGRSGVLTSAAAGAPGILTFLSSPTGCRVYGFGFASRTISGFTSAQEFGFGAFKVFNHGGVTGGTQAAKVDLSPGDADAFMTIADTTTLALSGSAGSSSQRIGGDSFSELNAAATVQRGFMQWEAPLPKAGMRIGPTESLLISCDTSWGPGGTARLFPWAVCGPA